MRNAAPPTKLNVLVVDDVPNIRALVIKLLGEAYLCTQAENGEEALREAKSRPLDLVITDLNMPVMDGIEFLRNLRSDPDSSIAGIPVIVMSSSTSRDEALKVGANAAIPKVGSKGQLRLAVEKVVKRRRRTAL